MQQGIFFDVMDILDKYIKIAFADINDYTVFGKKMVQAMGAFGPLIDNEGEPVMVEVNYVDFKESYQVDGTIISEVKKGKDGPVIKLADKMIALEMLSKYFDLLSQNDRKKLQEEKLKVDIAKGNAGIEKLNGDNDEGPIEIIISQKCARKWQSSGKKSILISRIFCSIKIKTFSSPSRRLRQLEKNPY